MRSGWGSPRRQSVFAVSGLTVMLVEIPETEPWVPWCRVRGRQLVVWASKSVMLAALFPWQRRR